MKRTILFKAAVCLVFTALLLAVNYALFTVYAAYRIGMTPVYIAARDLPPRTRISEEDLDTVLGLTPGAVTPFGLLNDKNGLVQLIIDETLRDEELFAMHPCVNTTTVRMSNRDFMEKVIPAMGHDPVFTEI